jgi:hypothetical protein
MRSRRRWASHYKRPPLIPYQRLIVAIAFRLATFDERGYTTNPTFLEDRFIVWTQTELNYSIMSATIPALRPVMNSLNTQFGSLGQNPGEHGYGYGYGYGNDCSNYQMSSLKSVDRRGKKDEYTAKQSAAGLDGREIEYSCDVWVPGMEGEGHNGENGGQPNPKQSGGDATSVDSNDSRQMIIRKDTTFQVAYEAK